ncbi:hypothetical protein BDZ85DRAFT_249582 [Elsinoe ampelina]|uniref:Uncharacterized protein n=1 Tax=Elsinoe ampelina TaxID=302913 RepID=A0A6A6GE52_9PEZI|nr:hypothetical protein BDZ85DRAFT_249582 [Elsinoe ampelina]
MLYLVRVFSLNNYLSLLYLILASIPVKIAVYNDLRAILALGEYSSVVIASKLREALYYSYNNITRILMLNISLYANTIERLLDREDTRERPNSRSNSYYIALVQNASTKHLLRVTLTIEV